MPVEVCFTANQEQDFNFNLQCRVKRKPTPLMLNVKAQGYSVNASLSYTSPDGEEKSLPVAKSEKRVINFGHVSVNERALWRISLYNNGQYAFEYRWVLSERCHMQGGFDREQSLVCIDPEQGMVEPHDHICCELAFAPPSKMTLKGCEITLEVSSFNPTFNNYGRVYLIILHCRLSMVRLCQLFSEVVVLSHLLTFPMRRLTLVHVFSITLTCLLTEQLWSSPTMMQRTSGELYPYLSLSLSLSFSLSLSLSLSLTHSLTYTLLHYLV